MRWILVAGNGPRIDAFAKHLRHEGFRVSTAEGPTHAVEALAARTHNCAVFIGLPAKDVVDIAHQAGRIFSTHRCAPPPFLSVATEPLDTAGMLAGQALFWHADASDDALLAHLRALVRRADGYPTHHRFGALGLDPLRARASLDGQPIALRPMEFNLLNLLIEAQGHPVSPVTLASRLWPGRPYCRERLAAQLHHLRRRLGGRTAAVRVQRVKSLGYALSIRWIKPARVDNHAAASAL